jgi:putative transcriptional regulator
MSKKPNRVTEALLETAEGMHRIGILDDEEYNKITVRHLGEQPLPTAKPISAKEIRSLRERANMSQAAFARSLNLSVGYISQLERGAKQPKGPQAPRPCDEHNLLVLPQKSVNCSWCMSFLSCLLFHPKPAGTKYHFRSDRINYCVMHPLKSRSGEASCNGKYLIHRRRKALPPRQGFSVEY